MKKRVISFFIACVLLMTCTVIPNFADDATDTITIRNQNVDGLPIPAVFDENNKVVAVAQAKVGKILNECGCDIVCVQEDFQYHSILEAQMTNYPYKTYTSGGVPAGDGLNIFSKYPIYNVERVAWNDFNGILDAANDGLTPKGFLKVTVDFNGQYFDLYDIHADANGSDEDIEAKRSQFIQLRQYIEVNSAGKAVVIVGDFNCVLHVIEEQDAFRELLDHGYKDAWAEVASGLGDQKFNPDAIIEANGGDPYYYYGTWDSLERTCYNSGFEATKFEYKKCSDDPSNSFVIADHCGAETTLKLLTPGKEDTLEKPTDESITTKVTKFAKGVVRDLVLIGGDLVKKATKKLFGK